MPKFKVDYTLFGSTVVEAKDSQTAALMVKGSDEGQVTDKQLLEGVEGYNSNGLDECNLPSDYTIDADAIFIEGVIEVREEDE